MRTASFAGSTSCSAVASGRDSTRLRDAPAISRQGEPVRQSRISEWSTGARKVPPYIAAHVRTLRSLHSGEVDQ